MNLSKRGEYALRALIQLATAHQAGKPLLRLTELSRNEHIPRKFLEQIFIQLREAGYVSARRGKLGGYFLARPLREISIGQVVRLIDGPLAPIACVSQTAYKKCSCPDESRCQLRLVMLDVRNAIANILDHYTLADVLATQPGQRPILP